MDAKGKSRIPENRPDNKEPAEGSRETVKEDNDSKTPPRRERPRPFYPQPRGRNDRQTGK